MAFLFLAFLYQPHDQKRKNLSIFHPD